jgi:hypothetical protein
VIRNLSTRREFAKFTSNRWGAGMGDAVDYVITIDPVVDYESDGLNYLVNFPGGIVFAPAWHGYIYHANIITTVGFHDGNGELLKTVPIETFYSMRHSEFDRTWYPMFSFNVLNAVGGIYTALVFDSDITVDVKNAIGDSYSDVVTDRIVKEIADLELGAG